MIVHGGKRDERGSTFPLILWIRSSSLPGPSDVQYIASQKAKVLVDAINHLVDDQLVFQRGRSMRDAIGVT